MSQALIALLALLIDAVLGDPPFLYRRVPHPVVVIGRYIAVGEQRLNQGPPRRRQINGTLLVWVVVLAALLFGWLLSAVLNRLPFGGLLEAVLASTLLAGRSLYSHVKSVADGLRLGLTEGRTAVAHLVGRDPNRLDRAGVARAAVESGAENLSDGLIAPLFWFLLLGLAGLCAYKAINTLDSMIGYRNERYLRFGRAAAQLDDLANYLPARLSGALLVVACWLTPGADSRCAWAVMQRDASKHRSPNAGWPEAAVAGALGLALAGPRDYPEGRVNDPWVGDGRTAVTADDIDATLALCSNTGLLLGVALLLLSLLLW